MPARFAKFIMAAIIMFLAACGSSSDNKTENGDDNGGQSTIVGALHLQYVIRVDNIPLAGPQTERVEMYISGDAVRYDSKIEIQVADETGGMEKNSLLDFKDASLAELKPADSTYKVDFFRITGNSVKPAGGEQAPSLSGEIGMVSTGESRDIGAFAKCREYDIKLISGGSHGRAEGENGAQVEGRIWLASDSETNRFGVEYYRKLAGLMYDRNFEGLEIWRILLRLGVSRAKIRAVLGEIDGLIVEADLNVRLYSLGKKANVEIKLQTGEASGGRFSTGIFEIPANYRPAFGKEGSL